MALLYNPALDPVDNTVSNYYHIRSTSKGGAGSGILGISDQTIPSANFPVSGTATRYFIYLDWAVDITDTGTRPIVVKNETTATTLTRVLYTPPLTTNTYKVFPVTSEGQQIIEIHVGVGSGTAGDTISCDLYSAGTVLNADGYNNLVNNTVSSAGAITTLTTMRNVGGIDSGATGVYVKTIVYDIGTWNMNFASAGSRSIAVAVGVNYLTSVLSFNAIIYADSGLGTTEFCGGVSGGKIFTDGTNITLEQSITSYFDSSAFSSTASNRGKIILQYLA